MPTNIYLCTMWSTHTKQKINVFRVVIQQLFSTQFSFSRSLSLFQRFFLALSRSPLAAADENSRRQLENYRKKLAQLRVIICWRYLTLFCATMESLFSVPRENDRNFVTRQKSELRFELNCRFLRLVVPASQRWCEPPLRRVINSDNENNNTTCWN